MFRTSFALRSSASGNKAFGRGRPLDRPSIVYSNNHLLVVNKPAGWHSVPNNNANHGKNDAGISRPVMATNRENGNHNRKCLRSFLQSEQLGGGSDSTFVLPVHRLDQPCTGLQLYAKTHRAASRIQSRWRTDDVHKAYLVVLEESIPVHTLLQSHCEASRKVLGEGSPWSVLEGYLERSRRPHQRVSNHQSRVETAGWSVTMRPTCTALDDTNDPRDPKKHGRYRLCSLQYKVLDPHCRLLFVETNDGARHMIRALFAMMGACVAGDLRYGAQVALSDGSVALHARRLSMSSRIPLGDDPRPPFFRAPIPELWKDHFGVTEQDVLHLEMSLLSLPNDAH